MVQVLIISWLYKMAFKWSPSFPSLWFIRYLDSDQSSQTQNIQLSQPTTLEPSSAPHSFNYLCLLACSLRTSMLILHAVFIMLSLLIFYSYFKVLGAQSCLTLCDPMDCSLAGSSVHGDSPGRNTGMGCHAHLQGIFPTQGSNLGLPNCRQIILPHNHTHVQTTSEIKSFQVYLACRVSVSGKIKTPTLQ